MYSACNTSGIGRVVARDLIGGMGWTTEGVEVFRLSTNNQGRVENRKSWKTTKPQVDPIDADKNKTICMF